MNMRQRVLYKGASLEILYDIISDMIIANWHGEQTEMSIMRGYEKILGEMENHLCRALLDDHMNISGMWVGAAEWVATDWFQRAQKKGLKYMAVVYSTQTFSRRSTEKAVQLMNSKNVLGFEFRVAAEKWLGDMLTKS